MILTKYITQVTYITHIAFIAYMTCITNITCITHIAQLIFKSYKKQRKTWKEARKRYQNLSFEILLKKKSKKYVNIIANDREVFLKIKNKT